MTQNRFKSRKRLFDALAVFLILILLFTVPAFAAEDPDGETQIPTDDNIKTNDGSVPDEDVTHRDNTQASDDAKYSHDADTTASEGADFFTSLYSDIKDILPEILSTLSLICSIILMFVYKSGFVPMVKEGIAALSSKAKSIADETNKMSSESAESKQIMEKAMKETEQRISQMELYISTLSDKLSEVGSLGTKSDNLKAALSIETEMLYELFMSASLPQYAKDKVAEKISAMRKNIGEVSE